MATRKMFTYSVKVYFEYDSGTEPSLVHLEQQFDDMVRRTFFRARTTRPKVVLLGQKKDEVVDTSELA